MSALSPVKHASGISSTYKERTIEINLKKVKVFTLHFLLHAYPPHALCHINALGKCLKGSKARKFKKLFMYLICNIYDNLMLNPPNVM